LTLLGWSQATESVDAGVPDEVAGALARALTSSARVTFPSSATTEGAGRVWSPSGDDLVRVLSGKGFGDRLAATLRGRPPAVALLSTRRPETAMRLFADASFPWWMQGQVVLLSGLDAPPPDIDEDALLASAAKTGRVVIVQEAPRTAGFGAELAAILAEKAMLDLRGPVLRVTGYDVPYPYWKIEDAYMPSVERIVDAVRKLLKF